MTSGQLLVEQLHMVLDHEEQLEKMCPKCRKESEKDGCIRCGKESKQISAGTNKGFDREKFERMKRGEN